MRKILIQGVCLIFGRARMSDSSVLRDMIGELGGDAPVKLNAPRPPVPEFVSVFVDALEKALEMIGRSGTEILHSHLLRTYGLQKEDVALRPGLYMSALKVMLETSCDAIEEYIVREV